MSSPITRVPVLLLKTRSTPADGYEEYFSKEPFTPIFVPVLEHRPNVHNLDLIRSLLRDGKLGRGRNAKYGGMIFTSQRAVEAFARVVDEVEADQSRGGTESEFGRKQEPDAVEVNGEDSLSTTPLPLYVVGPATSRILTSLLSTSANSRYSVLAPLQPQIFGSQTGNGEALAQYILEHYHTLAGPEHTLPLLFLVGEQRRDIIPKTLMDPSLHESKQIRVDELVVYETNVVESFATDFASHISQIESSGRDLAVVVVFSPSGCGAMLGCLGYIDDRNMLTDKGKSRGNETGKLNGQPLAQVRYVVAAIGPTTRDYLRREFRFEADVCAETPSPEGVGERVKKFLAEVVHELS